MIQKNCDICGESFMAERSTARYCCRSCRDEAYRRRKAAPLVPDGAPAFGAATVSDVAAAVSLARRASNDLARLSSTAPRQLTPGCLRISRAIAAAIDEEGW